LLGEAAGHRLHSGGKVFFLAVNLASRLESLSKLALVDIFLEGNTQKEVADQFIFQKVRFEQVRGKIQKVAIYHLKKNEPSAVLNRLRCKKDC